MKELVKLGALWAGKKDRNGNPMMTGKAGDARVLVLKNTYKEKEGQPDYIIYVTNNEPKNTPETSGDAPAF